MSYENSNALVVVEKDGLGLWLYILFCFSPLDSILEELNTTYLFLPSATLRQLASIQLELVSNTSLDLYFQQPMTNGRTVGC